MNDKIAIKKTVNDMPTEVYNAIANPEIMKKWYFDVPDFKAETGAEFNFFAGPANDLYHHRGKILAAEPPHILRHNWTYPEISDAVSAVEWRLEPEGAQTKVTLKHTGTSGFKDCGENFTTKSFTNGWTEIVTKNLPYFLNGKA